MNITFENKDKSKKSIKDLYPPLMVNGKNLIKLNSIRSQSRTNASSYERIPRFDVPEKEISFISEILGRNIEKNSWLLTAFQKKQKLKRKLQEETENNVSNNVIIVAPTSLPEIKEKYIQRKIQTLKPLLKKSAVPAKLTKVAVDSYAKHVLFLQLSNGIEITKHKKEYKYYIGPGNNDSLINKIMKKKPGWCKVYTCHSAHFIWTQVKKNDIVESLPVCVDSSEKTSVNRNINTPMFPNDEYISLSPVTLITPSKIKVYNRIERNYELCSKKRLFSNMVNYYKSINKDPFEYIPLTFHITHGARDPNFLAFKNKFREISEKIQETNDKYLKNCWLVKPGEGTNRGTGISVCSSIDEIEQKMEDVEYAPGKYRTYIIQKYVYRPMLYLNRKFDIRCYALVLCYNGNLQAYFYKDGYLRTSVAEFTLDNIHNKFIHLTNDAIQKKSTDYGKFEAGNKLSYSEFQDYINNNFENKANFVDQVYPEMVKIVKDTVISTCDKLDPKRRLHSFELLGYDFMIDEFFRPWLIEVNTNPCLALSGPYLSKLIPKMLEDALHIVLDQFFHNDVCDFNENGFVSVFNRGSRKVQITENLEILQSDGEDSESDIEAN